MKVGVMAIIFLALTGCANRTAWYQNTQPHVAPLNFPSANFQTKPVQRNISSPPVSPFPQRVTQDAGNWERLTYEDLMRFELDCSIRSEQIASLESQLKRSNFYRIGAVEGNASPYKISKSYYALAKYRIWTLRLACPGSEVEPSVVKEVLQAFPTTPPSSTRCYFEEIFDTKTGIASANHINGQQNYNRREICTNYPLIPDKSIITVGDQINFTSKDIAGKTGVLGLRKWRGNIYQVSSRTEIHQNHAVRFTLVLARTSGNQWVVVDKF